MRLLLLLLIIGVSLLATAVRSEDPPTPAAVIPLRIVQVERETGTLIFQPAVDTVSCEVADEGFLRCADATFGVTFVPRIPPERESDTDTLRASR